MREMPEFHVFYCCRRTGEGIASHAPAPLERDQIAALAIQVLEENGDFIGLVDDDDSVLQFIYLARTESDRQPIRMEIPDLHQRQNLIRHISNAELRALLQSLPDKLTTDVIAEAGAVAAGP
jgi:hypothetical protein